MSEPLVPLVCHESASLSAYRPETTLTHKYCVPKSVNFVSEPLVPLVCYESASLSAYRPETTLTHKYCVPKSVKSQNAINYEIYYMLSSELHSPCFGEVLFSLAFEKCE